MVVYIDSEYKCHTQNSDKFRPIDSKFFDGKCKEFIEGYRFIPSGESWTREDGVVFKGELAAPFIQYIELDKAQRAYERELAHAAHILLGEA